MMMILTIMTWVLLLTFAVSVGMGVYAALASLWREAFSYGVDWGALVMALLLTSVVGLIICMVIAGALGYIT